MTKIKIKKTTLTRKADLIIESTNPETYSYFYKH